MLVLAAPEITWLSFLRELLQNAVDFTADLTLLLNRAIR